MIRRCQVCNQFFNLDDSEEATRCQSCVDRHKNGLPPVKYEHPTWLQRRVKEWGIKDAESAEQSMRKARVLTDNEGRCQLCGDIIIRKYRNKKYCTSCARKRKLQQMREWAMKNRADRRKPLHPRECVQCGKEFVPHLSQEKYCSDTCRVERRRISQRKKEYDGTIFCKSNGVS